MYKLTYIRVAHVHRVLVISSVALSNTCHGQDGSKVVYWPLIGDGDHSRKNTTERFGRMKAHGTVMGISHV